MLYKEGLRYLRRIWRATRYFDLEALGAVAVVDRFEPDWTRRKGRGWIDR